MKRKFTAILLVTAMLLLAACSSKTQTQDTDAGQEPHTEQETDTENTGEKTSDEELSLEDLYDLAVKDAVFADEDEIHPLVSLTEEEELVTWDDEGRVLLCTWHNYPDSYPEGETVTIDWGYVWAFTDKEMASHAEEFEKAEDPEMRMRQIIAFAPDSDHSTVTCLWVKPSDVLRPAYQSDPADNTMVNAFDEDTVDEEFKEWFDDNTLSSYFYGAYPWTRLGYTYDWADNGTEYGLSEFIINPGSEVKVESTETTEEFLERISNNK